MGTVTKHARIRFDDNQGFIWYANSVYLAEVASQLEVLFDRLITRKLIDKTKVRFNLEIRVGSHTSSGTTVTIKLSMGKSFYDVVNVTHKEFKDVHGIVNFIHDTLKDRGWLKS